jgi:hypothetical protein
MIDQFMKPVTELRVLFATSWTVRIALFGSRLRWVHSTQIPLNSAGDIIAINWKNRVRNDELLSYIDELLG